MFYSIPILQKSLIKLSLHCVFLLLLIGHALIRYNNLGSAVYAKEKLNGFEYPPGNRLVVTFYDDGEDRSRYQTHNHSLYIWLASGQSQ